MTAVSYADLDASSPNGKFLLEARSPDNGTIKRRDGTIPPEDDFLFNYRRFQGEFRYRLLDQTGAPIPPTDLGTESGNVLWERWQESGEHSPHELVVSDEGWSIIRTHGFRPELIAVSPEGRDMIRVWILGPEANDENEAPEPNSRQGNVQVWHAARPEYTTAGMYWTSHSWRYFVRVEESIHFVWREYSGRRLVIDLTRATLVGEEEQRSPVLSRAMNEAESRWAQLLLSELATHITEVQDLLTRCDMDAVRSHPLSEKLGEVKPAILLAGVHRLENCIPMLHRLEEIDYPIGEGVSTALGHGAFREIQYLRPLIQHSLRLIGAEPLGFSAYEFLSAGERRFPTPQRVADRRARAMQVDQALSGEQVLSLLGSPDYVKMRSSWDGRGRRLAEYWEYDFLVGGQWETLRITWVEKGRKGRIRRIETVPPYWLETNERESDILRY